MGMEKEVRSNQESSITQGSVEESGKIETEMESKIDLFLLQSRVLDLYSINGQYYNKPITAESISKACASFLSQSKEITITRIQECCPKHFFRTKVHHHSDSFPSMTIQFPRSDCIGSLARCFRNLFFRHKKNLHAVSASQDELRIQVFDEGKLGLVTIGGTAIGRFEAINPSICGSAICNASIEVEIETFYGDRSQIIIRRDQRLSAQTCAETVCMCICCAFNTRTIQIVKNANQVNTFQIKRSSLYHFLSMCCSPCFNPKWQITQISLSTPMLNDIEKVMIIAVWLYQIEFIK